MSARGEVYCEASPDHFSVERGDLLLCRSVMRAVEFFGAWSPVLHGCASVSAHQPAACGERHGFVARLAMFGAWVRHTDWHPVAQLATNSKRLALVRISKIVRFPGTWPCMAEHRGTCFVRLVSCDMRGAVFTPFFMRHRHCFGAGLCAHDCSCSRWVRCHGFWQPPAALQS